MAMPPFNRVRKRRLDNKLRVISSVPIEPPDLTHQQNPCIMRCFRTTHLINIFRGGQNIVDGKEKYCFRCSVNQNRFLDQNWVLGDVGNHFAARGGPANSSPTLPSPRTYNAIDTSMTLR